MELVAFNFDDASFLRFMTDTSGDLAHTIEGVAEEIAVKAQDNVGQQWGGRGSGLNPPPGPPLRRTGDLQASIRATPATVVSAGVMESAVIADAAHRGFPYALWLRIQGYRFVDLEDISA